MIIVTRTCKVMKNGRFALSFLEGVDNVSNEFVESLFVIGF